MSSWRLTLVATSFSCFAELTVCEFCFTMSFERVFGLQRVCSLLARHSVNCVSRVGSSLSADSSSQ